MKVYGVPAELPAPQPDYKNYDYEAETAREEEHKAALKEWLVAQGYTGPHTGGIVSFSVGDGAALYMLGDAGKGTRSALIHLPYGDSYQYPHVEYLPKAEIVRIISVERNAPPAMKLFGRK